MTSSRGTTLTPLSRCGIGTAQFGRRYGKFNTDGIPSLETVGAILTKAHEFGLSLVDTACEYGDSERVLGEWTGQLARFDVVTKTPNFIQERITAADARRLREAFERSLQLMRLPVLGALLVHHAPALLAPGGNLLYQELVRLKHKGSVSRIGVSAYSGEIAEQIVESFQIDVVQLPINVLDQRLMDTGALLRLSRQGIEIHARSAFLQGLLLVDPDTLPNHFECATSTLKAFQSASRSRGLKPAHAALHYLLGIPEISRIVVGVESMAQLLDIFDGFPTAPAEIDFASFRMDEAAILNPVLWPR